MDKSKIILGIIVIALIIAGAIWGFSSCEPRTKTLLTEEIYGAFINANIDFTCELIKDPTLIADEKEAKARVGKIYEKYFLPVDDDKQMLDILEKYENDANVVSIVKTNSQPCTEGEDPIYYKTAIEK